MCKYAFNGYTCLTVLHFPSHITAVETLPRKTNTLIPSLTMAAALGALYTMKPIWTWTTCIIKSNIKVIKCQKKLLIASNMKLVHIS
jgi:hypothetical protein